MNSILPITIAGSSDPRTKEMWKVAQQLEANFLAEMLKSTGVGDVSDSFGGGEGEGQFQSFLLQAQAEKMVESGGIGLAQSIFESLKKWEE